MRLEKESVEKLKEKTLTIVGKYLDLNEYKVFFFGSRVNGRGDERSDIDIGIEGNEEVPVEKFLEIQEEIDNLSYLYKIEIVDFNKVSDDFRKVSMQKIELLN